MPDYSGFHDVRFPLTISVGGVGGEEMATQIHITASGYEYRNADWDETRGRWDVASRVKTLDQSALLTSFFRARKAMTYSFRWQPVDDYTVIGSEIGIGDDVQTVFNLVKIYPDDIGDTIRRIVLPVDSTRFTGALPLVIYKDAILEDPSHYTIDYRNGRVTFGGSFIPEYEAVLTWDGEFDVPARFGVSQLRKSMLTHEIVSFDEVSIIEVLGYEILETPDV